MSIISIIHAAGGFIGLACGLAVIIIPNKSNNWHKKLGKLYFISMIISSILAIFISFQMKHMIFLSIGGFTLYMLFSAFISLRSRFETWKKLYYILAFIGFACGMYMILTQIVFLVVFGLLQLLLVLQDLWLIRSEKNDDLHLLRSHAGKMLGRFIAATTAFAVNVVFSGDAWWHWLLPTLLIMPLIIIWNYRLRRKKFLPPVNTNA
ncbi:MAG: hypothetical protein N2167_01920 [Flavobacteriales bacterium]|nr:hypothetical protein [Flavobacteriales bacterium]